MKRVFILAAVLFFSCFIYLKTCAQITQYSNLFVKERFYLPLRDTNFTPSRIGAVVARPADGLLYYWNGTAWTWIGGGGGGGAVSSVYGRIGAVTAQSGDYAAFYPSLSGSYSNPSWITALAWSKLTGTPTSLSGYGITDPIVLTSGSYSNPSWITDYAWSKLTGTPTSLSGYGITDPIVLTSGSYSNPSWITDYAWSKLTGTPTSLSGYGITDAQSTLVSGTNIKTVNGNSLLGSGNITVGSSQTLNQTLRYGNSADTAVLLSDSLQAQKLDINKGGIGLGGYVYTTTAPIGAGGAFVKDSSVFIGASYESSTPPISNLSWTDLVAANLNTTVYRFSISGTGFQLGTANSFMTRLSSIPTYRPTLRYLFFGASNILNDYTLDKGYAGLDTAIKRAVDTMTVARGWSKERLILVTNPQTGNFSGNTSDTSRLYAEMAIKGAKLAGIRYVDIYNYMKNNGSTPIFMGNDSTHANVSGHYAIADAVLKNGTSSLVTTDGIKIQKGGINIQDNSPINFTSYNSTSANRLLTWDFGTTNNRSGIGKINTYGLGIFAPFSGDGVYMGLGQDATTLSSSNAHLYLTGITTAKRVNLNSGIIINDAQYDIRWGSGTDVTPKNRVLFYDWGTTASRLGLGTTADGNGGVSIFSQNTYYSGGDILLGAGYDATNMTRGNAALIVKPSNKVTVRDILTVGNGLKVGDTATNPTAFVDIAASTTAKASLRIRNGVAPTSPNEGEIWNDGTDANYFTGSVSYKLAKTLSGSATLDFASTNAQNSSDLTITVTGAAVGDVVSLGVDNASVLANSSFSAWVSATNTVTVRFNNYSNVAQDPASGTFKIRVIK